MEDKKWLEILNGQLWLKQIQETNHIRFLRFQLYHTR